MKNIIIDIDNTLWNFSEVFYEEIKKKYPTIIPVSEWKWNFWIYYMEIKEMLKIVNKIHLEQDFYLPFHDAKFLLESILDSGYNIIIASHREENTRGATIRFFEKYNLPYNEMHLSTDKTILFNTAIAIIDDSPSVLKRAKEKGLIIAGLKWRWNEEEGYPVFNNLLSVWGYVLKSLEGI